MPDAKAGIDLDPPLVIPSANKGAVRGRAGRKPLDAASCCRPVVRDVDPPVRETVEALSPSSTAESRQIHGEEIQSLYGPIRKHGERDSPEQENAAQEHTVVIHLRFVRRPILEINRWATQNMIRLIRVSGDAQNCHASFPLAISERREGSRSTGVRPVIGVEREEKRHANPVHRELPLALVVVAPADSRIYLYS